MDTTPDRAGPPSDPPEPGTGPGPGAARSPGRDLIGLWSNTFFSVSSSTFLYLFFAIEVHNRTSSVLLSNLVLVAPLAIPALGSPVIHRVCTSGEPRRVLAGAMWLGGLACAAAAALLLVVDGVLIPLCLMIGFVDMVQRVGRLVVINRCVSRENMRSAVPVAFSAQFSSGCVVACLIYAGAGSWISPQFALCISGAGFVLAALTAHLIAEPRDVAVPQGDHTGGYRALLAAEFRALAANGRLRHAFISFVVLTTLFQGYYNLTRVALPLTTFHGSVALTGAVQFLSSFAALVAAIAFLAAGRRVVLGNGFTCCLAAVLMIAVAVTDLPLAFLGLYFLFMLSFELVFLRQQASIVEAADASTVALVSTLQIALIYLGMTVVVVLGSYFTSVAAVQSAAVAFCLCVVGFWALYAAPRERRFPSRAPVNPDRQVTR
ncbi:hypothetical protein DMB66_07160 [Actinoplanes sp. ATCC 53533]|uniref:hypothetical protein n=1 Tax=Actinoplanes sp. ATCC 53533 TaxID=1288362 RepID=UPI000F76C396|nr:hypothetical protein [Actinoplanes sp. ATCC 53533]RSM71796.1 hypothetical protein DMB66_07160 [Actinoplanes sp. ATCC 53533]